MTTQSTETPSNYYPRKAAPKVAMTSAIKIALTYNGDRTAFRREHPALFDQLREANRLEFAGFQPIRGTWVLEDVRALAATCESATQFRTLHQGAYRWAVKNGHMDAMKFPVEGRKHFMGYWTVERCRNVAQASENYDALLRMHPPAARTIKKFGILVRYKKKVAK